MCSILTIDVVDGESVGEVGHVGLLSKRRLTLRGTLRAAIIQTLDGLKNNNNKNRKSVSHTAQVNYKRPV